MREWTIRLRCGFRGLEFSLPHPALRATFSRWEKESGTQLFGNCAVGQLKDLRFASTRPSMRSVTGKALPFKRQS